MMFNLCGTTPGPQRNECPISCMQSRCDCAGWLDQLSLNAWGAPLTRGEVSPFVEDDTAKMAGPVPARQ